MDPIVLIVTSAIVAAFAAFVTFTVMKKKLNQDCESKINAATAVAEQLGYVSGVNTERHSWMTRAQQAADAGTPWAGVTLPVIVPPVDNQQDPNWDPPAY